MNTTLLLLIFAAGGAAVGVLISWLVLFIPSWLERQWQEEAVSTVANAAPTEKKRMNGLETLFLSLTSLGLCVGTAMFTNTLLQSFFLSVLLLGLLLLAVIDLKTYFLPDVIIYPLLWLGLLVNVWGLFVPVADAVIGSAAGYMGFWIVAKGFALLLRKEGMGHGDFKLLAVLGAWLGWSVLPVLVIAAATFGLFFALGGIIFAKKHASTPVPFGPSLALSGALVAFVQTGVTGGIAAFLRGLGLA